MILTESLPSMGVPSTVWPLKTPSVSPLGQFTDDEAIIHGSPFQKYSVLQREIHSLPHLSDRIWVLQVFNMTLKGARFKDRNSKAIYRVKTINDWLVLLEREGAYGQLLTTLDVLNSFYERVNEKD